MVAIYRVEISDMNVGVINPKWLTM